MKTDHRKRRWWIALPLSLLWGVGYLYVGRPGRYFIYLTIMMALLAVPFHGLWGWLSQPFVLPAYAVGLAIFFLGGIIDTTRLAVAQRHYVPRRYNRWWVYTVVIALMFVVMSILPEPTSESLAVRNFSVPSESNLPTLRLGEIFTADTRAYETQDPQRGDMVIFKGGLDSAHADYVKRVIGLPGDVIEIDDDAIRINGDAIDQRAAQGDDTRNDTTTQEYLETLPGGRSYRILRASKEASEATPAVYHVPPNHYFVLGDNRDRSNDSRFDLGSVPRDHIYARADSIFYANALGRIGTRLN